MDGPATEQIIGRTTRVRARPLKLNEIRLPCELKADVSLISTELVEDAAIKEHDQRKSAKIGAFEGGDHSDESFTGGRGVKWHESGRKACAWTDVFAIRGSERDSCEKKHWVALTRSSVNWKDSRRCVKRPISLDRSTTNYQTSDERALGQSRVQPAGGRDLCRQPAMKEENGPKKKRPPNPGAYIRARGRKAKAIVTPGSQDYHEKVERPRSVVHISKRGRSARKLKHPSEKGERGSAERAVEEN